MLRIFTCAPQLQDLQLPLQSLPITTKVVSSNPVHGGLHSIQHYVIKFSVTCDMSVFSVSSTNKTDLHDITEILLNVALNIINQTLKTQEMKPPQKTY